MRSHLRKMVFGIIAASTMSLTGCSASDVNSMLGQGSAVSNEGKHSAIKETHVKLYYANAGLPKHYKAIGRVSAENYNMLGMENSQASIAAELKKQAATVGANGVINISTGLAQTTGDAIITK